jgi:hypothetical protein
MIRKPPNIFKTLSTKKEARLLPQYVVPCEQTRDLGINTENKQNNQFCAGECRKQDLPAQSR